MRCASPTPFYRPRLNPEEHRVFEDGLTLFYLFDFLPFSVFSLIDIALVSLVLYRLFGLIKGTRAGQMLVGLLLLVTLGYGRSLAADERAGLVVGTGPFHSTHSA